MENADLKAHARKLVDEIKSGWSLVRNLRGLSGLMSAAPEVVARVEALGHSLNLPGAEKKALAIETILLLVDEPAWLPEWVFRAVLNFAIERAAAALKKIQQRR